MYINLEDKQHGGESLVYKQENRSETLLTNSVWVHLVQQHVKDRERAIYEMIYKHQDVSSRRFLCSPRPSTWKGEWLWWTPIVLVFHLCINWIPCVRKKTRVFFLGVKAIWKQLLIAVYLRYQHLNVSRLSFSWNIISFACWHRCKNEHFRHLSICILYNL